MEYPIAAFADGRYSVEMMVMPRGEYHLEVLEEGEALAFVLLRGQISVQVNGRQRPQRTLLATPQAPVFLVTPGSYHVTANKNCVGFRGVRRV